MLEKTANARGEKYLAARLPHDRCPHCRSPTTRHGFITPDGLWLETHHCPAHGPVCPKGPKLESSP